MPLSDPPPLFDVDDPNTWDSHDGRIHRPTVTIAVAGGML